MVAHSRSFSSSPRISTARDASSLRKHNTLKENTRFFELGYIYNTYAPTCSTRIRQLCDLQQRWKKGPWKLVSDEPRTNLYIFSTSLGKYTITLCLAIMFITSHLKRKSKGRQDSMTPPMAFRSRSSSCSSFDESYFSKTYVPLSSLPTPPPSCRSNSSSRQQSPDAFSSPGQILDPELLGTVPRFYFLLLPVLGNSG